MSIISQIKQTLPALKLLENEPMCEHSSFKIGGTVSTFAVPASAAELSALCEILRKNGVSPLVIGRGSNLLVSDSHLNLFVIQIGDGLCGMHSLGETEIFAEAGISLARLAAFAADNGLSGLEFAHGIPGSLGGGIYMNAGAYGGELANVIRSVKYIDENGQLHESHGTELDFGYRHSIFSGTRDIIISAELELVPAPHAEILEKMRELAQKRRSSQPLDFPSAGSTFKRPKDGYAAALIDKAGLRGFAIGDAQVSEKHAGFVINRGKASFDDVCRLMEHIKKIVFDQSGIALEAEVRIIK